ncbi:MAG TPA: alpha/beta hydrolase fold domain-containing protein [Streptosporangiaceae bacterium]|nr:alpha/beta hydrolase fold domain-containing protein [Streptosporangiaceae bacterium]
MPTNRVAGLQVRGRAGTLQGRVYWPGPSVARQARLLVFWTVAGDGAWCQELSASAGLVVLAVACGRPYPADLDDAVTAAEWAAENTARLGADPRELLVGGAGPEGTLAAAVAVHAHAGGWPAFSRQVLVSPSPAEPMPPSLAGVAPATAVTVECDPGGDEGRYASLLRRAGVAVDELHYAAPDSSSAVRIRTGRQLLADLGAALSTHLGDHPRSRKAGRDAPDD